MQKVSIARMVNLDGTSLYIYDSRTGEKLRQYDLFSMMFRNQSVETEIAVLTRISEPSELHESNLWC